MQHSGKEKRHIRTSFLSSAAGIVVSFLVLAGIVSGLREAGSAVGWGFHFQQPLFLVFMVLVITLFAANLWGFFEINLPSSMTSWLAGAGHSSHFFSGMLATLLATPCSAPFVGTAIGFAFQWGTDTIFMIFFFMGLGLAAPYLLIALWPKMVSGLPKPGAWMLRVKAFLGALLFGTALWLIWIFAAQRGNAASLALLACIMAMSLVLWTKKQQAIPGLVALLAIIALSGIIFYLPYSGMQPKEEVRADETIWQPFDEQAIPALVRQGKTVFVDVTADWCVTCKANKLLVLDTPEIKTKLLELNVVAMEADFTNPSREISLYLNRFNRYGIPFNAVYGPGVPQGIVLPELLTKEAVIRALEQATHNMR